MGNESIVIIMLVSFDRPANFEVTYWFTPAIKQTAPLFLVRTVSSAMPVFLLRSTEFDRRRCSASSNMLAVLSLRMLLLLATYRIKQVKSAKPSSEQINQTLPERECYATYAVKFSSLTLLFELADHFLDFISSEVVDIGCGIYAKVKSSKLGWMRISCAKNRRVIFFA